MAHYFNGGIRLQARTDQRVGTNVRVHVSVLLGLLALVRAVDYWLERFELTVSTRGTVDGATYTDVNAQLPATNLLILIALAVGGAVPAQHPPQGLGAAGDGRGHLGGRRGRRRRHRAGRHPALPGRAVGVVARAGVHRAQHRRHPRCARPRRRRPSRTSRAAPTSTTPTWRPTPTSCATSACGTPSSCATPTTSSRRCGPTTASTTSTSTATPSTARPPR